MTFFDLHSRQDQTEAVRVFVHGGVMVHAIESDDAEGRLAVRDLPSCLVGERITQAGQYRYDWLHARMPRAASRMDRYAKGKMS